jgi:hypothetical protein
VVLLRLARSGAAVLDVSFQNGSHLDDALRMPAGEILGLLEVLLEIVEFKLAVFFDG